MVVHRSNLQFSAFDAAESLLRQRRIDDALSGFEQAERNGADAELCAAGRWQCWMLKGDFERAWKESDAIHSRCAADPNRFWDGSSFEGKSVILRCLHGYGDSIQMLRYAPAVRRQAARLIVEIAPAMLELARCFPGIDEVITWGRSAPAGHPEWDIQVEVMELPYIFRSTINFFPCEIPYLVLPPDTLQNKGDKRDENPRKIDDELRVGIFWTGGQWNGSRSLPFAMLEPLLEQEEEGTRFESLQAQDGNAEWNGFCTAHNLRGRRNCSPGMLSLAAAAAQVDLVITIDSVPAHLAGALGRPVWTMLPYNADWRWMLDRTDSPWYPTMRLFRQPRPGDWESVIREVKLHLELWREARKT